MSRTAVLEAKSATPPTHPSPAGYSRLQSAAVPIFSDFEGEQTVGNRNLQRVLSKP